MNRTEWGENPADGKTPVMVVSKLMTCNRDMVGLKIIPNHSPFLRCSLESGHKQSSCWIIPIFKDPASGKDCNVAPRTSTDLFSKRAAQLIFCQKHRYRTTCSVLFLAYSSCPITRTLLIFQNARGLDSTTLPFNTVAGLKNGIRERNEYGE